MKDMIIKTFRGKIKSIDEKNFTVDAIVSDESQDRDGEVIKTDAWKGGLKDYKNHPVLLSSHNYYDLTKQIGQAESIKVGDDGLIAKFKYFVGEGNPEADWAFRLASKGCAAYSVGFQGLKWDEGDYAKGTGRIFTQVNLLEVSQVLIPSNKNARQRYMDDPVGKELCELIVKAFGDRDIKINGEDNAGDGIDVDDLSPALLGKMPIDQFKTEMKSIIKEMTLEALKEFSKSKSYFGVLLNRDQKTADAAAVSADISNAIKEGLSLKK